MTEFEESMQGFNSVPQQHAEKFLNTIDQGFSNRTVSEHRLALLGIYSAQEVFQKLSEVLLLGDGEWLKKLFSNEDLGPRVLQILDFKPYDGPPSLFFRALQELLKVRKPEQSFECLFKIADRLRANNQFSGNRFKVWFDQFLKSLETIKLESQQFRDVFLKFQKYITSNNQLSFYQIQKLLLVMTAHDCKKSDFRKLPGIQRIQKTIQDILLSLSGSRIIECEEIKTEQIAEALVKTVNHKDLAEYLIKAVKVCLARLENPAVQLSYIQGLDQFLDIFISQIRGVKPERISILGYHFALLAVYCLGYPDPKKQIVNIFLNDANSQFSSLSIPVIVEEEQNLEGISTVMSLAADYLSSSEEIDPDWQQRWFNHISSLIDTNYWQKESSHIHSSRLLWAIDRCTSRGYQLCATQAYIISAVMNQLPVEVLTGMKSKTLYQALLKFLPNPLPGPEISQLESNLSDLTRERNSLLEEIKKLNEEANSVGKIANHNITQGLADTRQKLSDSLDGPLRMIRTRILQLGEVDHRDVKKLHRKLSLQFTNLRVNLHHRNLIDDSFYNELDWEDSNDEA